MEALSRRLTGDAQARVAKRNCNRKKKIDRNFDQNQTPVHEKDVARPTHISTTAPVPVRLVMSYIYNICVGGEVIRYQPSEK